MIYQLGDLEFPEEKQRGRKLKIFFFNLFVQEIQNYTIV